MLKRFIPILALVGICWLVFAANNLLWSGQLSQYGIVPRRVGGLPGIIWAPFLHGSLKHLAANTVPLLIFGGILCYRSRSEFAVIALAGTLLVGTLTWVFARNASHIGASGLIFCFFGYLASLAYFQRTFGTLVLSAVCILGYGGMLKGLLPGAPGISWESHVAGFLAGIALAWGASKLKPTPREADISTPGIVLVKGPK